jgi:hypothetical protein
MANYQSTLILFLLDKKGVPRFGAERYLCGLVETPQAAGSFSPATVTHDNRDNRSNIISLLRDFSVGDISNVDTLRGIGEAVWEDLGLAMIFNRVVENQSNITFLTNDPVIPWEWASPFGGSESICELLPCGNVFFEQISQLANETRGGRASSTPEEQIAQTKAILLFDEGGHHSLPKLQGVEEEITSVKDSLLRSGVKGTNIECVNGHDKHAEATFLRHVRRMRSDLGIIHYAGHILNGDIQLKRSAIERAEIRNNFGNKRSRLPGTLVFINGCESGAVSEVWEKEKNLSTAWLDAGALAMIGCRLPVLDSKARIFASKFYDHLLSRKYLYESIGSILQDTRRALARSSGTDASWLQYTLFGHSYLYFFEPKVSQAEVTATLLGATPPDKLRNILEQDQR